MKYYAGRFYITFRCNSQCRYCNVWCDEKFMGKNELSLEDAKAIIDDLKSLGIRYIDFTGGEPGLYTHILELVKYCKSQDLIVELTTNGLNFTKHIDVITPYIDVMNISIDTLDPKKYSEIRGVPGFDKVIETLKQLREKTNNLKIITVVSDDNLAEIDSLVKLAQELKIQIYLSPLFNYFDRTDNQANKYPIKQFFYEPYCIVNLHFSKMLEKYDPEAYTECYSNKKILTLGPDGNVILPCYHYYNDEIKWNHNLLEIIESEKFKAVSDNIGKYEHCKGCTILPYMGISLSYHFNKIFLYQAFSEEYLKFKAKFLNDSSRDVTINKDILLESYAKLEEIIDKEIDEIETVDHFYKVTKKDNLFNFSLLKNPLLFTEYFYDSLQEYCWDIEYSPHTVIKYFYNEMIPIIKSLKEKDKIKNADYIYILEKISGFQLNWWKFFILKYYKTKSNISYEEHLNWIKDFISEIISILPKAESQRIYELIFAISFMMGDDNDFYTLVDKNHHPFREEKLSFKFMLLNKNDIAQYKPFYSERFENTFDKIKNANSIEKPKNADIDIKSIDFVKGLTNKDNLYYFLNNCASISEDDVSLLSKTIINTLSFEQIKTLRQNIREYEIFERPELLLLKKIEKQQK